MEIVDRILQFIRTESDLPEGIEVDATTSLFRSRILSSVDLSGLILFMEDTCRIQVKPMDICLENFDSVSAMSSFVQRKATHDA
jgi:acyl carrier protein